MMKAMLTMSQTSSGLKLALRWIAPTSRKGAGGKEASVGKPGFELGVPALRCILRVILASMKGLNFVNVSCVVDLGMEKG
jgi:hypothetical protein